MPHSSGGGHGQPHYYYNAYVHDYINNPLEVAENNRARFEDMKEVVAEYDKIRARWRN